MSDPEQTDINKAAADYAKAEGHFDKLWNAIGSSPFTLAIFVVYSVALVAFGFWVGLKP